MIKGISAYESGDLTIETSLPLWIHTDGEVLRKSDHIRITCQREAIRILCPQSLKKF